MTEHDADRPPYRWAVATFAVIFCLYFVTLSPTIAFWDTSEYIAAAKVLGIPHPPGNPLFTLLAHVWGLLPLASDYARRINLFAAATSAAGAAIWFLVAERWLRAILPARTPRLAASFAGIFASATAWTVWNQSVVNEKVYTVSLLTIALVVWCAVRWADQPAGERRDRWIVLAVYLSVLSSTNHQMGVLGLPVVAWYVVTTDWRIILRWRVVAALAVVAVIGLSLHHVYLPMRAAQYPAINEGEPTGGQALQDVLNRVQYDKPPVSQRMAPLGAQLSNYWMYWNWQWGRNLGAFQGVATAIFSLLSLGGLVALIRRDRRAGLAAGGLLITVTLLLIYYLNFKYGYSYQPENTAINSGMREVRERDYFFVASFAFVGVLIAAAFAAIMRFIGDRAGAASGGTRGALAGAPVLLLACIPLVGNHATASRAGETVARDFAIDILQSVEPYGILITKGDNDTFPLWFAQQVLGVRRDVTLVNLSLANTDWHLRQIQRMETPEFDLAQAAPLWRPGTDSGTVPLGGAPVTAWTRPQGSAFNRTIGWLDSIPGGMPTTGGAAKIGNLTITFGRPTLYRSDIAILALIADNIGKRPVYFSWSDGSYPDDVLGLSAHLVSQGLVRKLVNDTVVVGGNIVEGPLGLTDYARTKALLFDTYHFEGAARDRPKGWVDPPSAVILSMYAITYGGNAPMLSQMGDTVLAARADSIATQIAKSIRRVPGQ